MKNLTKKFAVWMAVALSFMAILVFAKTYVANNNKFEVVHSQATQIPGYEGSPEGVRVYASPAVKWDAVAPGLKVLGWFFWCLVGVAAWFVGTDQSLGKKSLYKQPNNPWWMIFAAILLCAVTWFGGYSTSLDKGSLVKGFDDFKQEFQVSDAQAAKIRENGGAGTNIKDENGLLTDYFKSKN
ncbi:MAG: hypothetical protein ABIT05_01460 [Chitinophagaceae bacterium]